MHQNHYAHRTWLLPLLSCVFYFAFVIFDGCSGSSDAGLREFIQTYLKNHPKAEVQDIYKLMYQGVFGVGHLIKSEREAMDYLAQEMASMSTLEGEPLTEPCIPDGSMLRVNLRPFKAAGMDSKALLGAMMETAGKNKGTAAQFAALWSRVGGLIDDGAFKELDIDEYDALTNDLEEQNWPAVHHSESYSAAYKPAYRVISKEAFEKYFKK
jgi:hypothetical protein